MYTDIHFAQVSIDNEVLKATPVPDDADILIFAAPSAPKCRIEVYSVSLSYHVVPVDATNVGTLDVVFHDASADSDTVLLDDADFLSTNTNLVADEAYTIWKGVQSLDPGDTLRLALTITTPDTAGEGGLVTVAYRVAEWHGE